MIVTTSFCPTQMIRLASSRTMILQVRWWNLTCPRIPTLRTQKAKGRQKRHLLGHQWEARTVSTIYDSNYSMMYSSISIAKRSHTLLSPSPSEAIRKAVQKKLKKGSSLTYCNNWAYFICCSRTCKRRCHSLIFNEPWIYKLWTRTTSVDPAQCSIQ